MTLNEEITMDLREQFEKETGIDHFYGTHYTDQYVEWLEQRIESGQVDTIVMPDDAPTNNLPTYEECALRVSNAEYLKENDLENDDFYHDALLPNPIHEFIYEYDCADRYKSAWWMHRLEKLIEYVKSEA